MSEPVIAQKAPYAVALDAGQTVYLCACGLSKNQPNCDGSHQGTGLTPAAYTAEKTGTAYLCGCKATKTPPLCDGSHAVL
jgi:CDGSH-type Zn-finger protein